MRRYEIMFIVHPSSSDEGIGQITGQMEEVVRSYAGEVHGIDRLGKKKLAYEIRDLQEGIYILLTIGAAGECVKELERRLKVNDRVLRYLTVRVDEDLKRAEKIKAARLKKKARRSRGTEPEAVAPAI
jgi:small subunit ribosomal protein S6